MNLLPLMFSRMAKCIIDPSCDLERLLSAYPVILKEYNECLKTNALSEHIFSSDANTIHCVKSGDDTGVFSHVRTNISYVLGIYWENSYEKVLNAAHKVYK